MKKIISFSVWGNNKDYTVGAVRNMELAKDIYPGWQTWFYIHNQVDKEIINTLSRDTNSKVFIMEDSNVTHDAAIWRFSPLSDAEVSVFISRDTDSRLNKKEYFAVEEWMKSDKQFHCMRDHVNHQYPPVLAGMCGFKLDGIINPRWILNMLNAHKNQKYGGDQNGLHTLYRNFSNLFLEHDDNKFFNGKPFPRQCEFSYGSFIGQRITYNNQEGTL